ncbi:ABC transporter ATP-binding protein/permease [Kocuria flava]|uniref:ABC transporter ATP-binding protein n=1 Tax=Kocuria flava TaxID=446860 RepID=UPI001FF51AA7|nr:ABC transporter ATP-binding protein [Kocuria flava]MCJ8505443.1 ABC transporter ATP-binding protein/permease [Kocuria flava]
MSRGDRARVDLRAVRRTLALIGPHVHEHRLLVAGGVLVLLAEVAFRVLEPWPLKVVVDALSRSLGAQNVDGWIPEASWELLLAAGLATVAITGFRALCSFLATVAFALVGSRVTTVLRARVFDHVQALSARYHAVARTGDTVQRLVSDIGRLQEAAVGAGLPLLANVVTLVAMCTVMVVLDPLLAAVVVLALLAFLAVGRGSAARITQASRRTRQGEAALANTAHEALGAIRTVQAYGLEEATARTFRAANGQALTEGVRSRRLAAGLERSTDVIVGVATAAVVVGGGLRVLEGAMTLGDLVLFTTYLKTCMKPLRDLAKYTGRIARAAASGERVAELVDEVPDVRELPGARTLEGVRGELVLAGVDAAHGDPAAGAPTVLRGIDLRVPAGQHVAVVGPSGSGKSTLAALLVRSMDPVAGSVSLDGHDLRLLSLATVRGSVALLLQDSVLFHGSVRENIRLGRPGATDAEVEQAARAAQAHGFVTAFPRGYDTPLGERGSTVSGGQRQRLAIARALLRDAPVVVLDEATTGLDPEAAREVVAALRRLVRGRTSLAVTHDAALALSADRVLWLQDGRILLDGTPAELLADPDGPFAAWVEQQRDEGAAAPGPGAHERPEVLR